jgi:hypothetical protein
VEQHAVRLSSPQERGDLRRPLGQLNEDRPTVGLLSSTSRRSAIWLRIAIETPNATIRFYRPWDPEDRRLDADRSGGRMRVYDGMGTFISVMPWIRFE